MDGQFFPLLFDPKWMEWFPINIGSLNMMLQNCNFWHSSDGKIPFTVISEDYLWEVINLTIKQVFLKMTYFILHVLFVWLLYIPLENYVISVTVLLGYTCTRLNVTKAAYVENTWRKQIICINLNTCTILYIN